MLEDELLRRLDAQDKKLDEIYHSVEKIRSHFRREFIWKFLSILVPLSAITGGAWWLKDYLSNYTLSIF